MGGPVPQDDGVEAHYRALVALHALSPDYDDVRHRLPEGYRDRSVAEDLRIVARASTEQIPVSARLAVLYDLAKAGYPGREYDPEAYLELAASAEQQRVLRDKPVDAGELLDEILAAAEAREPLGVRPGLRSVFVHREVAFTGRDVCTVHRVRVDDVPAVWLYSEFETDAPFDSIAGWLDPHGWPDLSPMFFKRVDQVGPTDALPPAAPPPGQPHWQAVFHEQVQLVRRVDTLLRCNYWRDGDTVAATTYDLELSLDHQIDVDRGYLLVTRTGDRSRVQVLKIVSFTQDYWDFVALFVCPFWTEWIRGAVDGGESTHELPPSQHPDEGSPVADTVQAWIDFFGEAAKPYLELCTDASARMRARAYSPGDLVADGTQWWSQFAKDWARAWTNWSDTVGDVARDGLDASFTPPGTPRERGRGSASAMAATVRAAAEAGGRVVPVAGLAADDRPTCSELVSIGPDASTIPPSAVTVTVEHGRDGTSRVRLRTADATAPHGLYVGRLRSGAQEDLAPVQLYLSRATRD